MVHAFSRLKERQAEEALQPVYIRVNWSLLGVDKSALPGVLDDVKISSMVIMAAPLWQTHLTTFMDESLGDHTRSNAIVSPELKYS